MTEISPAPAAPARGAGALYILAALAVASAAVYVAVAALSRDFYYSLDGVHEAARAAQDAGAHLKAKIRQGTATAQDDQAVLKALVGLEAANQSARAAQLARPIRLVFALFSVAFILYLVALAVAVRAPEGRGLVWMILGGAAAFRLTVLLSTPIQESDIYRYIWDGNVLAQGVSPFRYSPAQVQDAPLRPGAAGDLPRLVRLREKAPAIKTALGRIQYAEVPTVYPPVSQAVFALAAHLTPDAAPLPWHVVSMKACFVLFDLATLGLLLGALRGLGRHTGWAVAYGWCPLVIKEVANSGHLDALAVFFTTLGLLLAARALGPPGGLIGPREKARATALMTLAALAVAMGVGAKLYPLALVPLLAATWMRSPGLRRAVIPAVAFLAAALVVCWPMLPSAPPPPAPGVPQRQDPSLGVRTFLQKWEINDLIFRVVRENVTPASPERPEPWFVVVPERWRAGVQRQAARWAGVEPAAAPPLVARALTGLAFLIVAGWLAWQAARAPTPARWLECAFLTLAWLWLLSPAQNPWYWLWALPLLPFARGRAWLAVSGFAFVYYLRFWLVYHWPDPQQGGLPVPGSEYHGAEFFDYVVVWLEYAPWLAWLAAAWALRRAPREE